MTLAFATFGLYCVFVGLTSDNRKDRVCMYGIAACMTVGAIVLGVM